MRKVATLMPEADFQALKEKAEKEAAECKTQKMGYCSIRNQLVDTVTKYGDDSTTITLGQLREIFELAK